MDMTFLGLNLLVNPTGNLLQRLGKNALGLSFLWLLFVVFAVGVVFEPRRRQSVLEFWKYPGVNVRILFGLAVTTFAVSWGVIGYLASLVGYTAYLTYLEAKIGTW